MNRRLSALACAWLMTACATSNSTGGADDATVDVEGDVADAAPIDVGQDVDATDAAVDLDASDATDGSGDAAPDVADVGVDTPLFDCPDVGAECAPTSVACTEDRTAVRYCSRCGFILEDEPCDLFEVCDEIDGRAACRACEGAECPEVRECEPSSRSCLDYRNVQVCDGDGNVSAISPCPAGRRCFAGSCGPAGNETASTCTVDWDAAAPETGCIGQLCLCSPDFIAEVGGDQCAGDLTAGYCTTRDCAENGCDYTNEVCADFAEGGRHGGLSFCVNRGRCAAAGRACGDRPGLTCVELPARRGPGSPIAWELGCWQSGIRAVGDACTSDAECAGGRCESQFVGSDRVSYCTAPCGAEGACPSNAVCVQPGRDASDPYLCLARPNAVDCPRLDDDPLHIRSTASLPRYGGGTAQACWFSGG